MRRTMFLVKHCRADEIMLLSSASEMAGTVVYLASPAGGYTNGQEIVVDGGFLAVNPTTK